MGESACLGVLICPSASVTISLRARGRYQNVKEKAQSGTHVEKIDETR